MTTSAPTVTFRPRRARKVAVVAAVVTVVVFTVVSFGLTGRMGDGPQVFQPGDQVAMIGLGLCFAAGLLLFLRPKVEADARSVRVRNVIGSYDLPWQVVGTVRFDRGQSFATLELLDDDVVTIVALQIVDKEHALEGVRALRALHAAAAAERLP